jgi:hypothetical protein
LAGQRLDCRDWAFGLEVGLKKIRASCVHGLHEDSVLWTLSTSTGVLITMVHDSQGIPHYHSIVLVLAYIVKHSQLGSPNGGPSPLL